MNTSDIVAQLDVEIARLQHVKEILTGTAPTAKRKAGRPAAVSSPNKATSFNPAEFAATQPRRTVSPEAREKIAAAQKKRWKKNKRAEKKAARSAAEPAAKKAARRAVAKKATSTKKAVSGKKISIPAPETFATPAS